MPAPLWGNQFRNALHDLVADCFQLPAARSSPALGVEGTKRLADPHSGRIPEIVQIPGPALTPGGLF